MNGILNKLRSARYILTIDQAYFQILLAKDSREITAFNVLDKELYYFTQISYGLTRAPTTFQRLLDKKNAGDGIIFICVLGRHNYCTSTFEEHLEWLEHVLSKIFAASLTVNPKKYEFCRSQVRYSLCKETA